MKVALFGGTGFVGSYIIDELIEQNITPRILLREKSKSKLLNTENCEIIYGDINNLDSVKNTIDGCDAVIYCIGIIREFPSMGITYENLHFQGPKDCIDIAKEKNIKRFILMSANGVKENGTKYQRTKKKAEEYLESSSLKYTIFRPSLIFGDPRGAGRPEFCTQLKKDMLSLPFPAPNFHTGLNPFNAGNFALSPIHVKDVAKIFVDSINTTETKNNIYEIGGEKYYWKEIIKIIANAYGKNKWTVPAPIFVVKFLASILESFPWFPVTKDQITMLVEGNICYSKKIFDLFKIKPIPYNKESLSYLKKY